MKGLVFHGPRDIRYETFPDPRLSSRNSAILRVQKCSICGSDLHIYHGDNIGKVKYGTDTQHFCVGHEFLGEVVEVGPEVHNFSLGQRVMAAPGSGCGNCPFCLSGQQSQCPATTAFGLSSQLNGGQAEYVCIPNADQNLMLLDGSLSDEQALLLTDAASTACFGIGRSGLQAGESIAIVGLGPIGLVGIELALLMGAAQVFAIDPVASRRAKAETLGAIALAPDQNLQAAIFAATAGRGVQRVFEASGAKSAIESTIAIAAAGGTISAIGLPQPDVALPAMKLLYKNLTFRAGVANNIQEMWQILLPLFRSGRLKAEGLFSHHFSLRDGADAYRLFDARDEGVLKLMIEID